MSGWNDYEKNFVNSNKRNKSYFQNDDEDENGDFEYFSSQNDFEEKDDIGAKSKRVSRAMRTEKAVKRANRDYTKAQRQSMDDDYVGLGNVAIFSPKSYHDVQDMIDALRRKEPIIMNLEGIANSSAQRILDFLSGASYAIGGSMRRIKEFMFLITPQGTGITDTNDNFNNR